MRSQLLFRCGQRIKVTKRPTKSDDPITSGKGMLLSYGYVPVPGALCFGGGARSPSEVVASPGWGDICILVAQRPVCRARSVAVPTAKLRHRASTKFMPLMRFPSGPGSSTLIEQVGYRCSLGALVGVVERASRHSSRPSFP